MVRHNQDGLPSVNASHYLLSLTVHLLAPPLSSTANDDVYGSDSSRRRTLPKGYRVTSTRAVAPRQAGLPRPNCVKAQTWLVTLTGGLLCALHRAEGAVMPLWG